MSKSSKLHNELARKALYGIVAPIQEAGGSTAEIMVVLESTVAGVLLACERINESTPCQTDSMLMGLEEGVRNRISAIRAGGER